MIRTLALLVVTACGRGADEAPEIQYDHEACDNCGMLVSDPAHAAALVTDDGKTFSRNMLAVRKDAGFEGIEKSQVKWTDDGFVFTGQPTTPPRYWRTLIDQMSAEEIARKRNLAPVEV